MREYMDRRAFLSILGVGGLSLLFSPAFAWGAEKRPVPGALLLARITTPPFRDSVVLLFEHGDRGSEGLIVNKPGHWSLGRLMAQMNIRFRDRAILEQYLQSEVLYGGPVGRDNLFSFVHAPPGKWTPSWNLGSVGMTRAPEFMRDLADGTAEVKQVLAFLGTSGWAPGQLQGEIAAGHWQVIYPDPGALPGLLFDTPLCDRFAKAQTLPEGLPVGIPRQTI